MSDASSAEASRAGSLPLIGGALALDFCNTASGRGTDRPIEHLTAAGYLVDWCRHAGLLDDGSAAQVRARFADASFEAALLRRAIRLRACLYRLAVALATGEAPDQRDVDEVASEHAACLAAARLSAADGGFGWAWPVRDAPEALFGPITASAVALLTQGDRTRLKRCVGDRCGWLFRDTTKANNRRWCEMEVCGNRAKQKRRRAAAT